MNGWRADKLRRGGAWVLSMALLAACWCRFGSDRLLCEIFSEDTAPPTPSVLPEDAGLPSAGRDVPGGLIPPVPLDVREEVRAVVDGCLAYAERHAALARIGYGLNGHERTVLERWITAEEPGGAERYALGNDVMNVLRRFGGDLGRTVGFLGDAFRVFLGRDDAVMADYCLQHIAAAAEGPLPPEVRERAFALLREATGHFDRTWSATALLALARASSSPRDRSFVERQTLMLLRKSPLDAVRLSCLGVVRRHRLRSAAPVLEELGRDKAISTALRRALAHASVLKEER